MKAVYKFWIILLILLCHLGAYCTSATFGLYIKFNPAQQEKISFLFFSSDCALFEGEIDTCLEKVTLMNKYSVVNNDSAIITAKHEFEYPSSKCYAEMGEIDTVINYYVFLSENANGTLTWFYGSEDDSLHREYYKREKEFIKRFYKKHPEHKRFIKNKELIFEFIKISDDSTFNESVIITSVRSYLIKNNLGFSCMSN